ncbi:hypothetical protein SD71_20675 [Cohnella kolymensis]|uniref:Uncharacterized protein n=1 Tax=Cohnella kolymensis TaxID=1590652 RepID=A0ABR5A067_9BACL|nr:hypothetical protein [Cohnella kolymensis]KIL34426.1 hypothetical protein SD71_20675 [Cohnella kolymensis]
MEKEPEPEIEVLRVTEPRPNIRYFTVPSSGMIAEKRLQEIMGFSRGTRSETAGKIAPEVSEPAVQYIKEKLLLWLKGD